MEKAKPKSKIKLLPFDASRYLDNDKAIAEYVTAVLEADDPDLLLAALADVARTKGMSQVAKDAGLGRESLYRALAPGAKPRFDRTKSHPCTRCKADRANSLTLRAHPKLDQTAGSKRAPFADRFCVRAIRQRRRLHYEARQGAQSWPRVAHIICSSRRAGHSRQE